ncbi:MAG: cell wall hydrolase [Desulfobulbaceae bacterium S3730MH12]|nr:MAG: cell wall hydrolase [Desulfobulbaceae bacterium S5133MH15]OEU54679.1 MAG: cell wall hydrolase [Desulfobulbaceae bacterium S3730MH12]OEU78504.1 MAG: cell wall hydrolase [Desulfobulbaceae bacterium C00003063]
MTLLEGLLWLTLNVYHEARSEPLIGQMAVALVTLNRANEKHLPIKDIVKEPYQFSWTFQKDSYFPDDPKAFFECLKSVYTALQTQDFTNGATHYHHNTIEPYWAEHFIYLDEFGSHKFYK